MKKRLQKDIKKLNALLNLERKIVGIKFYFNEEDYEKAEARTIKGQMPYCVMVRKASMGYDMKITAANSGCGGASNALGLTEIEDFLRSGEMYKALGIYEDMSICRNAVKNTERFNYRIYGIEIKALEDFNYEPDVVIMISNSYQTMRIMQGYAYTFGADFNLRAIGNQAVCSECTAYPYEKNHINISFLCSGTRHFNRWKEEEVMIGLPFNKFYGFVKGVSETLNATEPNEKKKEIEERLEAEELDLDLEYDNAYFLTYPSKNDSI